MRTMTTMRKVFVAILLFASAALATTADAVDAVVNTTNAIAKQDWTFEGLVALAIVAACFIVYIKCNKIKQESKELIAAQEKNEELKTEKRKIERDNQLTEIKGSIAKVESELKERIKEVDTKHDHALEKIENEVSGIGKSLDKKFDMVIESNKILGTNIQTVSERLAVVERTAANREEIAGMHEKINGMDKNLTKVVAILEHTDFEFTGKKKRRYSKLDI